MLLVGGQCDGSFLKDWEPSLTRSEAKKEKAPKAPNPDAPPAPLFEKRAKREAAVAKFLEEFDREDGEPNRKAVRVAQFLQAVNRTRMGTGEPPL